MTAILLFAGDVPGNGVCVGAVDAEDMRDRALALHHTTGMNVWGVNRAGVNLGGRFRCALEGSYARTRARARAWNVARGVVIESAPKRVDLCPACGGAWKTDDIGDFRCSACGVLGYSRGDGVRGFRCAASCGGYGQRWTWRQSKRRVLCDGCYEMEATA